MIRSLTTKQKKVFARILKHFNRNMDKLPDNELRVQLFERLLHSHQKRTGALVWAKVDLAEMETRLRAEVKAEYAALRKQVSLSIRLKRARQRAREVAERRAERKAAAVKRQEERDAARVAASVARAKKKLNKNKALVDLAAQHGSCIFPGLSTNKQTFMKSEYDRIQRELAARQEAGLPAAEQFRYLQELLVKHGHEYGYRVKVKPGCVLWLNKLTHQTSYVFGLSPGYTFPASKRLWAMGKKIFRVAIFYNETNVVAYGRFTKWLLERRAKMSVFNLTEPRVWQAQVEPAWAC